MNESGGQNPWTVAEFMAAGLQLRKARNPRYSLRAFAAHLKVSAGFLSQVMRRQRVISEKTAESLAQKLRLPQAERELFLLAARWDRTTDPANKESIRSEMLLRMNACPESYRRLREVQIALLAKWESVAIFEALSISGISWNSARLAKSFGLTVDCVESLLSELAAVGLIQKTDDGWVRCVDKVTSGSLPNATVRASHSQFLDLAKVAVETQPKGTRHISGTTFPCDRSLLPEAFERIAKFRRELTAFLESGTPDSVYRLSLELFRLDVGSDEG